MPKNKTGGRKAKKKSSKYENEFDINEKALVKLVEGIAEDEFQEYGMITKLVGCSRVLVDCATKITNEEGTHNIIKNRMCRIRGKLKKRNWMNVGDVVIVSLHDFNDNDKGDIIHKFSMQQANYLKKQDIIQFEISKKNTSFNLETNEQDNDAFDFEDNSDNENSLIKNNVGTQPIMDYPPSDSSDEEDSDNNVDIDFI